MNTFHSKEKVTDATNDYRGRTTDHAASRNDEETDPVIILDARIWDG